MAEPGSYRHHNGGRYQVLFVALESTNGREDRRTVVYVSLSTGKIRVREETEFDAPVPWPDGRVMPRFVREDFRG